MNPQKVVMASRSLEARLTQALVMVADPDPDARCLMRWRAFALAMVSLEARGSEAWSFGWTARRCVRSEDSDTNSRMVWVPSTCTTTL